MNRSAYQDAIMMLSRKGYSERQIREKLHRKNHSSEMIEQAIKKLVERGYLNDTALCNMLLEQYQRTAKFGRMGMINKLRLQGFSEAVIQETLDKIDEIDEGQMVRQIIEKMQRHKKIEPGTLYRRLLSRGFSATVAREAALQVQEKNRNQD